MKLWRIAAETRSYSAHDLSGRGAARNPGRWNDYGEKVVYGAATISLAVLETVAHIDDAGLPQNRYVVAIEVPEPVWLARATAAPDDLPLGWDAIPAGLASVRFGSEWLRSQGSAVLLVPSVIVPEESIALVNPAHSDAASIVAHKLRRFEYHRVIRD